MDGQQLRAKRKEHGYTLKQLSERTGLAVSFLSDLERGVTNPSIETLHRLARAYGLELRIAFVRPSKA